ncbi:MAG: PspA/IM30 family protein [Pseudomonadota bacterium]
MFELVKTIFKGSQARAADRVRDHYAVDLLEQKVREADQDLATAKRTLASLIMRERNETRALQAVQKRIEDLEARVKQALDAEKSELARDGAIAIADLENEAEARSRTVGSLQEKVSRMRLSIEKTNRRIVELKQGMIEAKSLDAEHAAQRRMNRSIGSGTNIRDAEALIKRIKERDDPVEMTEVLDEIDQDLDHTNAADKLAANGFGDSLKTSADDVLARLSKK